MLFFMFNNRIQSVPEQHRTSLLYRFAPFLWSLVLILLLKKFSLSNLRKDRFRVAFLVQPVVQVTSQVSVFHLFTLDRDSVWLIPGIHRHQRSRSAD